MESVSISDEDGIGIEAEANFDLDEEDIEIIDDDMGLEEATARNVRRRLNASGPRHPQQRDDVDEEDDLDLDDIDAGENLETRTERIRRFDRETKDYYEDKFGESRPDLIRLRFTDLPKTYLDEARIIDVDAEDDPGDGGDSYAGMKLPKVIIRSKEERNLYFRQFFRTMCRCGDETYRLLEKVIVHKQQLSPTERHNLQTWSTYFHSYLVEHYYDILGSVEETPTGPGGAKEQTTGAMCLSVEIWRMKLLLNYHRLASLKDWKIRDSPFLVEWLLETPGVRLDHPPKEPILKTQKDGSTTQKQRDDHKEAVNKFRQAMAIFEAQKKIDTIPVLQLKQTQVMRLVHHITSRLRILPYHDDLKKLFELCELRVAMFFCQTMPDTILNHEKMRVSLQKEIDAIKTLIEEEANVRDRTIQGEFQDALRVASALDREHRLKAPEINMGNRYTCHRDFWIFMSSYWYPIWRSQYFIEVFPLLKLQRSHDLQSYLPAGATDRLRKWCLSKAKSQGDKYDERLADVAAEAHLHPGDMDWQNFRFPDESTHVAVVARKTRGEDAYEEHYSQMKMGYESVLAQTNRNWLSTVYVISLFDRYLTSHKNCHWRDGYVINNSAIDDPEVWNKIKTTREPLLVNIFSNYWLMMDCKVLPCNDIYTSICMWMVAVRKTRHLVGVPANCLNDNVDISDLLEEILDGKVNETYIRNPAAQEDYINRLKGGGTVYSTRIHI